MKKVILITLILLMFFLPLIIKSPYILNLLITFFIYITLAESWNLLGGYTGQISLGHGAFFGVGALVTRILWIKHIPIYFALPIGGLATSFISAIVGIPCFRMRMAYFPIGTLALSIIALLTVSNIFIEASALPPDILKTYEITPRYYLGLMVAVASVSFIYFLVRTRSGLAMVAIRENEKAASAIGIKTLKFKIISLLISTFMAGLSGGIYAYQHVSYYFDAPFDLTWSFSPALTSFIGGIGTITGPILGCLCFLALGEVFAVTLGEVHVLIFGFCFILIVLFLPGGLLSLNIKKIFGWKKNVLKNT